MRNKPVVDGFLMLVGVTQNSDLVFFKVRLTVPGSEKNKTVTVVDCAKLSS